MKNEKTKEWRINNLLKESSNKNNYQDAIDVFNFQNNLDHICREISRLTRKSYIGQGDKDKLMKILTDLRAISAEADKDFERLKSSEKSF